MKKVLAINDISCVGKVSLTTALPVISGFGSECSILPTALLSAHTKFETFTFLDLTEEMKKIIKAWDTMNLEFDAVYSGFLGCSAQVDIVKDVIARYKTANNTIVIDPVMGDKGKLYSIYDDRFVSKMKELVVGADIITPNTTEAHLLTGTNYRDGFLKKQYVNDLMKRLKDLGSKNAIMTGIPLSENLIGTTIISETGEIHNFSRKRYNDNFSGTGDVFASALVGSFLQNDCFVKATEVAVDFVTNSLKISGNSTNPKFGLHFEKMLCVNQN